MCCGCSTKIIQLGGAAPFSFQVTTGTSPYAGGAGIITGPFTVDNINNVLHLYSANTLNIDVAPGSVNTHLEVRIDPNPLNTITVSAAGLLSLGGGGGGVNIYNSDGTITDPNRIVTIGASTLNFNADNAGFLSNTAITTNQFRIDYSDPAGYAGSFSDNSTYNEMANGNAGLDEVARIFTQDSAGNDPSAGIQAASGPFGVTGIDVNSGSNLGNYINLYNNLGTYFELRLDGDPGVAGYTIISQGPGASPIWGPVTVTANSLDNLFFTQDIDWDFGGNNWNISNIDNWNVAADDISFTSNTFDVSSPIACFSGITQNDALTRFLVQDIGGCLSWRDVSTLPSGGGTLNVQDEGITVGTPSGITNINFVGAGVSVAGVGVNATVTISGGAGGNGIYGGSGALTGNTSVAGGGFDLSFNNINNLILDATCIQLPAPRALLNPNIVGFQPALVIDPGSGCLAEQYMDQDWLTIQTTTPELFAANNAWRVGGIGIIGFPHASNTPFDTQNLVFDIEVAGGTRNIIGVNTISTPGSAEGSFQLLAPATGGSTAWSAISIGASVDTGFGTLPNLVGPFASPASDNLMITHKSTTGGKGGDVPMYMLYGAGATNASAGHIFTDTGSVNSFSVPSELVTVGSVNRTPRIHIHNDNVVGNDEASLLITTDVTSSIMALGVGEFLNGAGNFVSAGDPNLAFWSFAGTGTTRPFITLNKVGGVAISNVNPQSAANQDLLVEGQYNLVTFSDYPSTRDDSGTFAPVNFLYTDNTGNILSAPTTILGGGGGMTSFTIFDGTTSQTIVDTNQITFVGGPLLTAVVSATDTVTYNLDPGSNGQIMYTIAGTPTWAFPQDILNIINFSTNVTWNFGGNDWTVNNVNDWIVDSDTISFNAPVICFTGIAQNNALTRILAQDVGGCLSWRDVTTISPLTVQDEGVTIGTSGGITQMNFVGAGVTVGGGGSNTTITIPGAAASQNLFDANDTLAANRVHAGAGFDFTWRGFGQHITNAIAGGTSATINLEPDGFIDGMVLTSTNGGNSGTLLNSASVNGSNIEITAVGVTGTGKSRTTVDDLNQNIESFILADVAPPGGNVNMVRAHYTSSFLAGERNRIDIMSTDGYYTLGNGGDVTTHPPLNNTINNVLVHQAISGRVFIRDQATITSALATKEEVIPTVMGLKDIAKMRVVDYKRKEDGIAMTGMIAEELHALDPKYSYDGESMVFPSVIGTLVKAVQELEAKIKILENR